MWRLPGRAGLDAVDETTIRPKAQRYLDTKEAYQEFATSVIERLAQAEDAL